MDHATELFELADTLKQAAEAGNSASFRDPILQLQRAIDAFDAAWSRSWLGYQANVYYRDFKKPPPHARFSIMFGIFETMHRDETVGEWITYEPEYVHNSILTIAGDPDLTSAAKIAQAAKIIFEKCKYTALEILEIELNHRPDKFVERLRDDLEKIAPMTPAEVAQELMPSDIPSRDSVAAEAGIKTPPHKAVLSDMLSMQHSIGICSKSSDIISRVASYLERRNKKNDNSLRVGTNVFIGHGGAKDWLELKDFVRDRLKLPYDEFNRLTIAGVPNIVRLAEMLDAAAIAFLVMTAEDEMADGSSQARMNVIHEAGLFQGRLGFHRAIVLLEEGCAEFSNINGLGQIRFPKGKIAAAFEQIRLVLEREGLIQPS